MPSPKDKKGKEGKEGGREGRSGSASAGDVHGLEDGSSSGYERTSDRLTVKELRDQVGSKVAVPGVQRPYATVDSVQRVFRENFDKLFYKVERGGQVRWSIVQGAKGVISRGAPGTIVGDPRAEQLKGWHKWVRDLDEALNTRFGETGDQRGRIGKRLAGFKFGEDYLKRVSEVLKEQEVDLPNKLLAANLKGDVKEAERIQAQMAKLEERLTKAAEDAAAAGDKGAQELVATGVLENLRAAGASVRDTALARTKSAGSVAGSMLKRASSVKLPNFKVLTIDELKAIRASVMAELSRRGEVVRSTLDNATQGTASRKFLGDVAGAARNTARRGSEVVTYAQQRATQKAASFRGGKPQPLEYKPRSNSVGSEKSGMESPPPPAPRKPVGPPVPDKRPAGYENKKGPSADI